jgi:hypothetical protein
MFYRMVSFQIMMNVEEFILINQKIGILVNQAILLMDKLIFIQYYYLLHKIGH